MPFDRGLSRRSSVIASLTSRQRVQVHGLILYGMDQFVDQNRP
jgi:hypothetical protein